MKIRLVSLTHKQEARLEPFIINRNNVHLFEKQNGVYLRKNRLSTVLHVDIYGRIKTIEGENPKKLKIGNNVYNL